MGRVLGAVFACCGTGCRVSPACASIGGGFTRSAVCCRVNSWVSSVAAEVAYWFPAMGMRSCSRS
eukprot:6909100-Alexandrium_andersonii.AAC.1